MLDCGTRTNTKSEVLLLVDSETTLGDSISTRRILSSRKPDANLRQSVASAERTTMFYVVFVESDDNKMENTSSLGVPSTSESSSANTEIILLKSEATIANVNRVEGTSSLEKTVIDLGIAHSSAEVLL